MLVTSSEGEYGIAVKGRAVEPCPGDACATIGALCCATRCNAPTASAAANTFTNGLSMNSPISKSYNVVPNGA
jgi:hypothetical protein